MMQISGANVIIKLARFHLATLKKKRLQREAPGHPGALAVQFRTIHQSRYNIMLTNAQFTSKLNSIKTSVRAARKNVQTCVIDAFEAVSGNSPDLTRLTRLRNAIEQTHGLNAAKLIGYIGDHVANISWAKQKDGTPGYKKTKKGEAIEVTMPDAEYYWYDWKPESAAETTFDFGAAIKRAVARAHKEGLVETPDDVAAFVQGMIMRGELEKALSTPEVKKAA